ncbi:MAG: DUF4159 domain-containing protein [Saprospiraceae bacterium]|jgi:hypothetical protein|nr:DUF4159 domain-containing protein [Saprospiraceae bacterium]MBL0026810.1 DUF4159 domain-containing protein [Saprospiraceae bacterium]
MNKLLFLILISFFSISSVNPSIKIGLLKYGGGGDWYANPTSLVNLSSFCNKFLGTNIDPEYGVVDAGSVEIFNYPLIHMTGHGNVVFSNSDAENLRQYLTAGGFLHIDDNYGMDPYVRLAMKKVFPELTFTELPFNHPIYNQKYKFDSGVPKIHEHDGKPSQGFGLILNGRLICFYSYESDLGDGWEDPEVHKDPEEIRIKALKMGANIVQYVFGN